MAVQLQTISGDHLEQHGENTYSAEASALEFPPSLWPTHILVNFYNTRLVLFTRTIMTSSSTTYRSEGGTLLVVLND